MGLVGILKSVTVFVQSQALPLCVMEDFYEKPLQWDLSRDILQHGNDNIYSYIRGNLFMVKLYRIGQLSMIQPIVLL